VGFAAVTPCGRIRYAWTGRFGALRVGKVVESLERALKGVEEQESGVDQEDPEKEEGIVESKEDVFDVGKGMERVKGIERSGIPRKQVAVRVSVCLKS
jgi:hypothetical protein